MYYDVKVSDGKMVNFRKKIWCPNFLTLHFAKVPDSKCFF